MGSNRRDTRTIPPFGFGSLSSTRRNLRFRPGHDRLSAPDFPQSRSRIRAHMAGCTPVRKWHPDVSQAPGCLFFASAQPLVGMIDHRERIGVLAFRQRISTAGSRLPVRDGRSIPARAGAAYRTRAASARRGFRRAAGSPRRSEMPSRIMPLRDALRAAATETGLFHVAWILTAGGYTLEPADIAKACAKIKGAE